MTFEPGTEVELAVDLESRPWGFEAREGTLVEVLEQPHASLLMVIPVTKRDRVPTEWFYVRPEQVRPPVDYAARAKTNGHSG